MSDDIRVSSMRRSGLRRWRLPVLVVVVPIILSTGAAVVALLLLLDHQTSAQRLDLIRTALAIGAGVGAVMTLVLGWRRQWSSEHDAAERRLTDLYVKAIEQLGSDKAAVRHGALYALERVAQNNSDHRQVVTDVICAYLRASHSATGVLDDNRKRTAIRRSHRSSKGHLAARITPVADRRALLNSSEERRQEQEVRLTAERILCRHLRPVTKRRPVDTFWPSVNLDLTNATLLEFVLEECIVGNAQFKGARFGGQTSFSRTQFDGNVSFDEAIFDDGASFVGAIFNQAASFSATQFMQESPFAYAEFNGYSRFDGSRFVAPANFRETKFETAFFLHVEYEKEVNFKGSWFAQNGAFDNTWFGGGVTFDNARFDCIADFGDVTFDGETTFIGVHFSEAAYFDSAQFAKGSKFTHAKFRKSAWFKSSRFLDSTIFDEARFGEYAHFDDVQFGDAWFRAVKFTGPATYEGAIFAAPAHFEGSLFGHGAKFGKVKFDADSHFQVAQFKGPTRTVLRKDFFKTTWQSDTEFRGVHFGGTANFHHAQFSSNVDFRGAQFLGDVRFQEATLPEASFADGSTVVPWVNFDDARFDRGVPLELAHLVDRTTT